MRQRWFYLLALSAAACDMDSSQRDRVGLTQAGDPSTAEDAAEPSEGDGITHGSGSAADAAPNEGSAALPIGGGSGGRPRMDASTADDESPLDGGADTAPADAGDPYACTTRNDCTIRNVGNCCGYYPRCANVNAIFTPPDCSGGQLGVCGFPVIDSCDCHANRCVSLQAGITIRP